MRQFEVFNQTLTNLSLLVSIEHVILEAIKWLARYHTPSVLKRHPFWHLSAKEMVCFQPIAHHSTHGDDLMVASSFVILLRPCVKLHYQIAPVHKTETWFFRMACYKFSGLAMNAPPPVFTMIGPVEPVQCLISAEETARI